MLKRKIEDTLLQWKNHTNHKPLVIMGIRQYGKTFIAQRFAQKHYKTVVYINFIKQPERISAFVGSMVGGQTYHLPHRSQFLL